MGEEENSAHKSESLFEHSLLKAIIYFVCVCISVSQLQQTTKRGGE